MDQTVVENTLDHTEELNTNVFMDLHALLAPLEETSVEDRARELAMRQRVRVVAVGGFPIIGSMWCGAPITVERVRQEIRNGLGTSALLTYMNRSQGDLNGLADICTEKGHDWAFRWMTLSILFTGYDMRAELAFTRDTRFFMSWPVGSGGGVFVANGALKDWIRFTQHHNDRSFDPAAREAMKAAREVLGQIVPTAEQHFLTDPTQHRAVLSRLDLRHRKVLEIGVGHGELTRLIFEREPLMVVGFELQKGLCEFNHQAFFLIEDDARTYQIGRFQESCIIANPPYSLLPWIRGELLPLIWDVVLLIPAHARDLFPDFKHEWEVSGTIFSPPSRGQHLIIQRGFDG